MFRLIKVSYLTISSVLLINGLILLIITTFVLSINKSTMELFYALETICKSTSEGYGGLFPRINTQASLAVPIAICSILAGIISVMGAVTFGVQLLKIATGIWSVGGVSLIAFLVQLAIGNLSINDSYKTCFLNVFTDLLRANSTDKTMSLIAYTESFNQCCGVCGPEDYWLFPELFGSDRYPPSCCYNNKDGTYNCEENFVSGKKGCYNAIRSGISNGKKLYTYTIATVALFIAPIILKGIWLIWYINKYYHFKTDSD